MKEGWNVIIKYDHEWRGVNVWLVNKQGNREMIVNPVNLQITTDILPQLATPDPTFRFHGHDAEQFLQGLSDALAGSGYRPDAMKVADERLVAIDAHLQDMRALVFKQKNFRFGGSV
jgi:hypothetical protein